MKMKSLKRTVLMATACFGLAGVVLSVLETLGARVFELLSKAASASAALLVILLIILFALGGMCAWAFIIVYRGYRAANVNMVTLEGTQNDVVLIKKETLDEIVKSIIGQPDGVADVSIATEYKDLALDVKVNLTVDMSANIASVTHEMQLNIRKQLEEVNGIRLSGVSVIISGINVPENREGMIMPWSNGSNEEKAEETSEEPAENAALETLEPNEVIETEQE
ncbi:MAG: hypothetical protein IKJ65_01380 [Clostridia bacterium]|nr:hypothetical protein [Clostridia bacterium]